MKLKYSLLILVIPGCIIFMFIYQVRRCDSDREKKHQQTHDWYRCIDHSFSNCNYVSYFTQPGIERYPHLLLKFQLLYSIPL
jgi:hypothetical protein